MAHKPVEPEIRRHHGAFLACGLAVIQRPGFRRMEDVPKANRENGCIHPATMPELEYHLGHCRHGSHLSEPGWGLPPLRLGRG